VGAGFRDRGFLPRRNLKDAAVGFLGLLLGCLDMGVEERIQTPASLRRCPAAKKGSSMLTQRRSPSLWRIFCTVSRRLP
jgi:hypothetical protein